ncbi:alcohol dehydrogenase catalytic domain-containing protein [bacterium]|nr:alcohol dehydrogenase catalytic domain-containing protein [bacterium]
MLVLTNDKIMKVPRFLGEGKIDFIDKPVPKPGLGQLLIRVKANALCGSEKGRFLHGSKVTPGHEAAGIVAAAGPGTNTPVGTPGVIYLIDFCGKCRNCKQGATNQCLDKQGDMGFNRDGGYGAYELVSEHIFFPVDEDIPLTEATLLLDVMSTGGHAIGRGQKLHSDIQSLVVTGAGPIGLGVLAMAKIIFGKETPVLISDVIPYRLELAEKLGGLPLQIQEKTIEEGLQMHGIDGVDLAVDASGKSSARQACLEVLNQRGVLVCVGHGEKLDFDVSGQIIHPERAVVGSEYLCYNELAPNLERLRNHRSYLSQIITHRYPVDEIQQAFETFLTSETGKVVVEQFKTPCTSS